MANRIKMAIRDLILRLYGLGWSQRRIAEALDLNRETVGRHIRLQAAAAQPADAAAAKPAIPPAGSEEAATPAGPPAPAKPAIPPAGTCGRRSDCAAFHSVVLGGVEAGLTAQRIYQDLQREHGFTGGYDSVKRYVRRLSAHRPERVERMECAAGEEAQVDFGRGAPVLDAAGRRRGTWVFRTVLSHSRKGYSEAVYRQGTEEFIRCLENALRAFGGVPRTLVIDNLRAAVAQADWYEPELTPKVAEFSRHYGTVILPTRPYHPEHKGKVERGIGYVKDNALKKRVFGSLAEENAHLRWWEERVADQRLHGTTRQHVGRCFAERERPALQPLPPMPFPCFEEGKRTVHRDACVEVKQAYYPVPEEYIGREVWARWDGRLVRLFNLRLEPIGVHPRLEPGQFAPRAQEPGREGPVTRTADYWCLRAAQLGPHCGEWAQQVRLERGVEAIRVLLGLQQLARKAGHRVTDAACAQALHHHQWRLRDLRQWVAGPPPAEQLEFLERHPLIRDLGEYATVVGAVENGPAPELPTAAPAGCEGPCGASMDNSSSPARAVESEANERIEA